MGKSEAANQSFYILVKKEEKLKKGIEQGRIVSLVDSLFFNAISSYASDIHLEPTQDEMRVRYRLDGVLYDRPSIKPFDSLAVLSRIKILSSLDIAQRRVPQDGKIRVKINEVESKKSLEDYSTIDMRVSTFPSVYGEKMVIRILDKSKNLVSLDKLGFEDSTLQALRKTIKRPHGFFLVTGPTGSGKSTTLYAILSELNDTQKNIVTMEDPVEYNLDGIIQSQINDRAGFSFENGLRAILRQDPDVVMVGEIRDKITAQIAIESALTGHLVFSTLHTNDSSGAVTRLIDMGIEPFLINATLSGVLAQRLVRKLCDSCKNEADLKISEKKFIEKNFSGHSLEKNFSADGCGNCLNLGYKGRTGIFELLLVNDDIRELILEKSATSKIKNQAIKGGMFTLLQDGAKKVEKGLIGFDELLRITVD